MSLSPAARAELMDCPRGCRALAEAAIRVADGRATRTDRLRARTFVGWFFLLEEEGCSLADGLKLEGRGDVAEELRRFLHEDLARD